MHIPSYYNYCYNYLQSTTCYCVYGISMAYMLAGNTAIGHFKPNNYVTYGNDDQRTQVAQN